MKEAFLTVALSDWAKAIGFSDPDDVEVSDSFECYPNFHREVVESTDWEWDEDEDDRHGPMDPGVWEDFCQKFGIDAAEWSSQGFLDHLQYDYEEVLSRSAWEGWFEAVESATECILTHLDIKSFHPINIVDLFCPTAMVEIPDDFPDLEWEIKEEGLSFYGSDAPLIYLLMVVDQGEYGSRFIGIRDYKDTYSITNWEKDADGTGYHHVLKLPLLAGIFGFRVNTSWSCDECPAWDLRSAVDRIKTAHEEHKALNA